ncbi:MAG TPA: hypothetical protein PK867_19025 [Pirellulales bacterium]|nr:hypothetical protein [Pirellulales bacterium]
MPEQVPGPKATPAAGKPSAGSSPRPAVRGGDANASSQAAAAAIAAKKKAQRAASAAGPHVEEGKGAYKYLPLECPNCGFQGKVKIARLDQTFHCQQCKQAFHVTRDGTVAGERPPDAPGLDVAARSLPDEPPWVERAFVNLPPAAKWGVLGGFVLLLALGLVYLMQPEEPLPGEMEDRATLACKSLAVGDWSMLKRLAKKGTAGDLGRWYDRVRPADWEDVDQSTQVDVKFESQGQKLKKYEGTHPVIDKIVRFTIQATDKPEALDVALIFSEDKEAQWWLDGEQMLKEYRPAKKKAARKNAEEEEE